MKKHLPSILIGVFTVLVIGGLVVLAIKQPSSSSPNNQPSGTALNVGDQEIDFTLKDLNNQSYTLSSYKGKSPVFIEFFAVWCPHCQAMAPLIDQLYGKYKDKGAIFLNIQGSPYGKDHESGSNASATMSDLTWFKNQFKVPYPILQDYNTVTANKYAIPGFPDFYIIDKNGKVTYTSSGEIDPNVLSTQLDKVIK